METTLKQVHMITIKYGADFKAGAYDYNPNVRREGTPKYYQVMDRELLEVWGYPRALLNT